MRGRSGRGWAVVLTAAVILGADVSAHRRDELLQAARLSIEPAGVNVDLTLTPGIEVAEATIAEADRDGDRVIADHEAWDYCRQVAAALSVEVDGRPFHLQPAACTFPAPGEIKRGEGTIELRLPVPVPPLSTGEHQLLFRNAFRPDRSVYLANALVPGSDRLAVTGQDRDAAQRALTIDFRVAPRSASLPVWPLGAAAGGAIAVMLALRREVQDQSASSAFPRE